MAAQLGESPDKIVRHETAVFPIGDRLVWAQTVHVDRDIHIVSGDLPNESLVMLPPIAAKDRARTMSILRRAIIRPRMQGKFSRALRAPISQKPAWPPAFEVATTPDVDVLHVRQFQSAIDPAAAGPARRGDCPIRMIIERDDGERLRLAAANPKRAEMMKIARAIKNEGRDARGEFPVKRFDQSRRSGKTQLRSPTAGVDARQSESVVRPGAVKIDMYC